MFQFHSLLYKAESFVRWVKTYWLALLGSTFIFLVFFAMSVYGSESAQPQDDGCQTYDQLLVDIRADTPEHVEIYKVDEAFGDAANEFAVATGWEGEFASRAVLLLGIDHNDGVIFPRAFAVLVNADGCVIGTSAFNRFMIVEVMKEAKSKHGA
jgi:hypothetical protein